MTGGRHIFKGATTSGRRRPLPSINEILATVSYNAATGVFTRIRTGREISRSNTNGYIIVKIGGIGYVGHRVAWKLTYGADPSFDIDHIDGDKKNNAASNLRQATPAQNSTNRPGAGSSGYRGISFARGRWSVVIYAQGKTRYVGSSRCPHEAAHMYNDAARAAHGEFAFFNVIDRGE